ncbi:hypothetical protein D6D18_05788 [Aureobasidium pullulans]|nr:hypothetical protein D6D18_05788 [Aureobasidium pullulans]
MDDPLKGYFNHQGVRHIGFKNHRKYRRSYHGSLNHRHHHYNVRQLDSKYAHTRPFHMIHPDNSRSQPRPSSIYPLNSATRSTTNSSIPTAIKPSTWKCTLDPTSDLDPHHPSHRRVPDNYAPKSTNPLLESTFYIKAGVFTDMTLKPYAVALKISRRYTMGSGSYIQRWQCYTGKR